MDFLRETINRHQERRRCDDAVPAVGAIDAAAVR